ncbi:MAG: PHP domain-containing protein [Bacillota bacterium]
MRLCDLHLHSTASDGTQTPSQVVAMAAQKGLASISLTDHDTADGCCEALAVGEQFGITVITGVEINADYEGCEVHLLGYGFDPDYGPLAGLLVDLRLEREERMATMVALLQQQGFGVTLAEVYDEAKDGAVGRPHLARVMVKKGYAASVKDAFDDLLATGRPAYVARRKLSPADAIAAIHGAGAVSVVAHPGLIGNDEVVRTLVKGGVMGLEVYHTEHGAEDVERYERMARDAGLLITGGSDYHGPGGKEHGEMGMPEVPNQLACNLLEAIRVSQGRR